MASAPPPKPWERQGTAVAGGSAVSPLGGATSTGVSHWDQPQSQSDTIAAVNESTALAAAPSRPWLSSAGPAFAQPGGSYGSGYGAGNSMYGSSYGTGGSMYGRPGYGSGMYGGGSMLGSSGMYGGGGYGSGMYGSGMYGSSYGGGGGMLGGGYGMGGGMGGGMFGGGPSAPYGQQGPDGPPRPPGAWESVLRGLHGVMGVFGRITMLVDENTYAVNFFIQALLQLLDRFGSLYGELARWVLRLLGWGRAARKAAELEQGQQQQQQPPQIGFAPPGGQRPALPPAQQQQPQPWEAAPAPVSALAAPPAAGRPAGSGSVGFDAAWVGGGSR